MTAVNICGRVPRGSTQLFTAEGSTINGDPNYGYVQKTCSVPDFNQYESCGNTMGPNPNTTSIALQQKGVPYTCSGNINGTSLLNNSACYALGPCQYGNEGFPWFPHAQDHYACASNWDNLDQYRLGCCGMTNSNSDKCAPEWCPSNLTGNIQGNPGCSSSEMSNFCSTFVGYGTGVWTPGSSVQIYCNNNQPSSLNGATMSYPMTCSSTNNNPEDYVSGEQACDNFINYNGNIDITKSVITSAITNFYKQGDPKTMKDDPFTLKVIDLCNRFPGTCDNILKQQCANYTIADLNPNTATKSDVDPSGDNLLNVCGCFLPPSQYTTYDNSDPQDPNQFHRRAKGPLEANNGETESVPIPCNSICRWPGNIQPSTNNNGIADTCGASVCYIDDVTIDLVNSNTGNITLAQMCPPTQPNSPSQCYIGTVDVQNLSKTQAGVQIVQNCSTCYTLDPNNPSAPIEVQCNCPQGGCTPVPPPCSGNNCPPSPTPTPPIPNPTFFDRLMSWIENNKAISISIASITLVILIALTIILVKG